jgi:F0F1-type ATP synthase membrane subunit b/b'
MLLALAMVFVFTGECWAAGGMQSKYSPITKFWFYVFNFTVFLLVVTVIYRKKLAALLAARHDRYRDQVTRAAVEVKALQSRHSALVERLGGIEDEAHKMLVQFDDETARIEDSLVKRASADAHLARQNMAARIRDEQRVAKREIEAEIFRRAVEQSKHEVVRLLRASTDVERKLREDIITAFVDS